MNTNELLKYHNMSVTWAFVPAKYAGEGHEQQINWIATIWFNDAGDKLRSTTIDYHQGLGYLNPSAARMTVLEHNRQQLAIQTGRYKGKLIEPPSSADLFTALHGSALASEFEDWALDYGYDPDSRKAEKVWHECRDQVKRVLKVISGHSTGGWLAFDQIQQCAQAEDAGEPWDLPADVRQA